MRSWVAITAVLTLVTLGQSSSQASDYQYARLVESWYHRYLHRPPDACGLENWVRHLRCGASPEFVQAAILGSDEYYCAHGRSAEGYVAGLYADVLGRAACREEIHEWVCNLNRCGCRVKLAQQFLCAAQRELHAAAAPVATPVYTPQPVATPSYGVRLPRRHGGR